MAGSLRKRAISAIIWNAIQKYGSLIIGFTTNVFLARLLTPEDFGLIGVLTVFIAVATAITESGFNSSLIQKQDVSQTDYCTVFYWNIIVALVLMSIIYFMAPAIAAYFGNDVIVPILRIESIILIVNSFCLVQTARLMKYLKFKELAFRTLVASLCGSAIGILLAIKGFGVWSLVWQGITNSLAGSILLWRVSDWKPSLAFSWKAFKNMYKFGMMVFLSSIFYTIYINIQSFIIGKSFSVKDLGYFTQAKKLETVPVDGTASVLNTVLFPVYSSVASDRKRHKEIVRKNINIVSYLTFPLMSLLIVIAPSIIVLLYGHKWDYSIPMFQILCINGMFAPLNMANTEIFRSIGAGGVYLSLNTLKRIFGLAIILWFVQYGLYPFLWAIAAIGILTYVINMIFTDKKFGYNYREQLSDILPSLLLSILSCGIGMYLLAFFKLKYEWYCIPIVLLVYLITYLCLSIFFKIRGLNYLVSIIKSKH